MYPSRGAVPSSVISQIARDHDLAMGGLPPFAGALSNGEVAPRAAILRVANNEEHEILQETLVSRTMLDLVVGSGPAP